MKKSNTWKVACRKQEAISGYFPDFILSHRVADQVYVEAVPSRNCDPRRSWTHSMYVTAVTAVTASVNFFKTNRIHAIHGKVPLG